MIVSLKVSNGCRGEKTLGYGSLIIDLFDSEGGRYNSIYPLTKGLKSMNFVLGPIGSSTASMDVNFAFVVPKGTKVSKLRVQEGTGHSFVFDLK